MRSSSLSGGVFSQQKDVDIDKLIPTLEPLSIFLLLRPLWTNSTQIAGLKK
jgi:hypothetical protein